MNLESIEDIINFASEKEKEAIAFYEELSKEEPYAGTKEIFQEFAREEKKHQAMLEEFLKDKAKIAAYRYERIPDLKISDYLVDVVYKKGMYYTDVLRLAMKREEKSVKLYMELAKQTDREDLIRIFHILSQEEARHKLGLETLYDAFMAKQGG